MRRLGLLLVCIVVAGSWMAHGLGLHAEPAAVPPMPLSAAERAWLATLPTLTVTFDSRFAPFVSVDAKGRPEGIAADYFQHVVNDLGLKVRYVSNDGLAQTRALIDSGNADIVLAFNPQGRSGQGLRFSQPYIEFPLVIATRQDASSIAGLSDLGGSRVAADTDRESVLQLLATSPHPVNMVTVHDTVAGLALLDDHKVDAVIGNLAIVDLLIRSRFAHLRVAAPTHLVEPLSFAVRESRAGLVPLMNRSLARVTSREAAGIRNTWLSVNYTWGGSWSAVLDKTWPIALPILLALVIVSIAWSRLRREVRLRLHSEQQLKDVTRNLPAVVFRFILDNQGQVAFVYVDGDTVAIFGVTPATFIEDEPSAFRRIQEDYRPALLADMRTAAATLSPLHCTVRVAGERWVTTHALPRRLPCGGTQFDGYWIDVTVEHEQGLALSAARDEAESATHAKTEFLATMSHEIRTPMYGVLGTLELLGGTRLDAEQRSLLGTAGDSATLLLQVLDDVLDFSMIEAGRLTLEPVAVDLRELIDRTIGMVAGQAQSRDIALRVKVDADVAAVVLADDVRVRQVLLNLVGNAIKFTSEGSVTLDVTVANDKADPGWQRLALDIIDTGIGIAPEVLPTLFAPFTQGEGSTRRRFGGSGLGLSICHQLVQLMGGTITLTSQPGAGTRARVEFAVEVATARRPCESLARTRVTVAVADDFVRQALTQGLAAAGLAIQVPGRSSDADLVFTDQADAPLASHAVLVSTQPDPRGFSFREGAWVVSTRPLRIASLPRICELALGHVESEPAPAGHATATTPAHDWRILVADDNRTNQELIRAQLRRLGYSCTMADDGGKALHALGSHPWDLAIIDVHMPVLDGYAVAQQWRAHEAGTGRHLPMVAMTANAQPDEVERCRAAGMDDFIAKPANLASLRKAMDTWLPATKSEPAHLLNVALLRENFGSDAVAARIAGEFSRVTRLELAASLATLDQDTPGELRLWLHRTVGGMHVFGSNALTASGDELENQIAQMTPAAARTAFAAFGERLVTLLDEIDRWTAGVTDD